MNTTTIPDGVNTAGDETYFGVLMGRLKEALSLGSDTALADALGMKQSAFANRKKTGSIPFENVIKLARERDLDMAWLFSDVERTASLEEASPQAIDDMVGHLVAGEPRPGGKTVAMRFRRRDQQNDPDRFSEFELVDRKGILGSAGPGAENVVIEPKGALAFRRDWLQSKRVNASRLIVADVVGDSMEPTLFHGDVVVFIEQAEVTVDDIYLFSLDGRLFVKRLRYIPGGGVEVISDNREHYQAMMLAEKEAVAQRFEVKGRFFWRGGDRLQ